MRKLLPWFLAMLTTVVAGAQDIPLFSQKLTNSFVYNPALAGHTFGSLTYAFKQNYSNVSGSPQNHFLSIHTPIANHRVGIGANVYQEDVTFLRNLYASGAFAYHLSINKLTTLSMGVSAEYNAFGTNGDPNFNDTEDIEFRRFRENGIKDYDFSFGMHFQNRYVKAGLAANRLSTTWIKEETKAVLSNYYSGFAQGLIPLRNNEDLLEPYVAYRKLSEINNTLDVGLYYTFNNMITAGGAYRTGNVISGTLGFRVSKYLMFGYSREMITGNVGGFVGAANEFTLRFDFNENNYKERFRADYKSSVAYRRKTLSSPVARSSGNRSPKQLQKRQKKLAPYSPNSRYQNTKKLSVKVKKGSSFNNKKSRKKNYKKRKPGRRR